MTQALRCRIKTSMTSEIRPIFQNEFELESQRFGRTGVPPVIASLLIEFARGEAQVEPINPNQTFVVQLGDNGSGFNAAGRQ